MASRTLVLSLTLSLLPALLAAQTPRPAQTRATEVPRSHVTIEGAAGTTLDGGFVVSAAAGVSPTPWLTLLAEGQTFHLPTRHRTFASGGGYGESVFTTWAFGGEMRIGVPVTRRLTPYGVVGMSTGTWKSNVDDFFPRQDSGGIVSIHAGGGVRIAVRRHLSLFADARLSLGAAGEDLMAYVPIRGGLAWEF
jgi:hypothetical protein